MPQLRLDQIKVVLADVAAAARFLKALGAEVPETSPEWTDWASHHVGIPTVADGFTIDLDSTAFARYWGGLPDGFTGVVVNLRTDDRGGVDIAFEIALVHDGEALRPPYDTFWGARYAVVRGPGPIVVGIMSPADPEMRSVSPELSDFA